jgi:hypothetical protein
MRPRTAPPPAADRGAALLDSTLDQPGWQEGKKLAGKPYAAVTSGLAYHDDSTSLREAALENRENVVRLLNSYIASLLQLRDDIEDNDRDAVASFLDNAWSGRAQWFEERVEAEWLNKQAQKIDAPSFGDRVNQMLFGSALTDRTKAK